MVLRTRHNNKMKKGLILLAALSLIGSTIVFSNAHRDTRVVKADATYIEGYYARTGDDTTKSNLYFYMEENGAPYDTGGTVRYRPLTRDAIILEKADGEQKQLPADYPGQVEAITKYNTTKYYLENWIFNLNGGLDIGDTIVLNGDFYNPANDVTLHIKETKFYVDSDQKVSTIPQKVNNITSHLKTAVPSVTADPSHGWACLFWGDDTMTFDVVPLTKENGFFPTSKHNLYINGEPKAVLNKDLVRRRDNWGKELYINLNEQIGNPNPAVGSLVVVDGVLCYKNFVNGQYPENPTISLESGEYFGIEINMFAFLKVGEGRDDYQVIDLKDYLVTDFNDLYDYDIYEVEDFYTLRDIKVNLASGIDAATNVKEVYEVYNAAVEQVEQLTKSEDGFDTYKESKKEEIRNYVSLDNYLEEQQLTIEGYINSYCEQIDSATTTKQILAFVAQAKSNIDSVETKLDFMENAILNQTAGYERYLQGYDEVTLNDLSLGESQTFHGLKDERDDEINTNSSDKCQINTFVPNSENKNGNVIFNFYYQSDCVPTAAGNLTVVLRGIALYGFKFVIGTNSHGWYSVRTIPGTGDDSFKGGSNVFNDHSKQYAVSVGAIDLIEGDRTWITFKVDGVFIYSTILDSLSFCKNARVSLSNNGDPSSDVAGTTTISNYYPSSAISKISPIYGGIFDYEEGHGDLTTNLYLTLDENDVAYDINKNLGSYATKNSDIKFVRGSSTYDIAKTDIPVIAKYGPNSYQLYLSQLFNDTITNVIDGDKVIISGVFTYYNENDGEKIAYEIANSVFVYDAGNSKWNLELSLEDCKQDIIRRINRYNSEDILEQYEDAEKTTIVSLVNQYVSDVNNATSVDTAKELYSLFVVEFNNVLNKIEKYRQNKITALQQYISDQSANYYEEDWAEIQEIKQAAIIELNKATDNKAIEQIYNSAIESIDAILTTEEHQLEELNNAKHNAIAEVKNHYGLLDIDSMSDSALEALNQDTLETIENIKDAESIEQVDQLLNEYKSRHKLPSQSIPTRGCGGNIYTTSILLSVISLMGIAFVTYKKRKHVLEDF